MDLARERQVPICGKDFKTGQTFMKTLIAPGLKSRMLGHAFRFVQSVVFLVHPDNIRSQRSLEKLAAVRIGERPDGSGNRSFAYSIAREQYESSAAG